MSNMDTTCIAIVTVEAANARTLPRSGTPIVGIGRRGERLEVSKLSEPDSQNFVWVQVLIPENGLRGWIRGDLVQLSGDCQSVGGVSTTVTPTDDTSDPEPDPTPEPQPEVLTGDCQGEVSVMSATVRSSPSLSSPFRGFVNRGTRFVITDISEADNQGFKWYECDFKGAPGWIREDLVIATGDCLDVQTHLDPDPEPDPDPIDTGDPDPQPSTVCVALVGLPSANVRATPNANGFLLGSAVKDSQLPVLSITGKQPDGFTWTEVQFQGLQGFVRSDLVVLRGDCSAFSIDDRFPRPVSGRLTQGFQPSSNPTHRGVDFGTSGSQELRTPIAATVERAHFCSNCTGDPPNIFTRDPNQQRQIFSDANWGFGYGHHIILKFAFNDLPQSVQAGVAREGGTGKNVYVLYAHLSQMDVNAGDSIEADTVIGKTGHTGFSTAEHLHMEVAFGTQWFGATKIHPARVFNIIEK